MDGQGDVFVADTGFGRVVEVKADGTQTTVASGLNGPQGVAVDSNGDVFIANTGQDDVFKVQAGVPVTVTPGTPTAKARSVNAAHDADTAITLAGTDPDSPALPLTYAFTQPSHGSVAVTGSAGSPTVVYTPAAGYYGADSFSFTASNGTNTSNPATVTLAVAPAKPTANPRSVAAAHDAGTAITLTGTDGDDVPGLGLTYSFTQPAHGVVAVSGVAGSPTAVYTPAAGYHGADSFSFTVSNGTNTSKAATVTLAVAPAMPTAAAKSVAAAHDATTAIILSGTDGDDAPALPLSYAFTQPSHGRVTVTGSAGSPSVVYTPAAGYEGPDSFSFTASDGSNASNPATVTLAVAPATPTAAAQAVAVAHDAATAITLTGTDGDDSPALPLTYSFAQPSHGSVAVTGSAGSPTLVYTPAAGYYGADSFSFTASNGTNASKAATVTLAVAPATPTAAAQAVAVAHDGTGTAITLSGTDGDDSPALGLTYAFTQPSHGRVTVTGSAGSPTLVYTPAAGYYRGRQLQLHRLQRHQRQQGGDRHVGRGPGHADGRRPGGSRGARRRHGDHPHGHRRRRLPGAAADLQLRAAVARVGRGHRVGGLADARLHARRRIRGAGQLQLHGEQRLQRQQSGDRHPGRGPGQADGRRRPWPWRTTASARRSPSPAPTATTRRRWAADLPGHGQPSQRHDLRLQLLHRGPHYTPHPGYQGPDSFSFTAANGTNASTPAAVALSVAAGVPTAIAQTVAAAHDAGTAITLAGTDGDDAPALPLTYSFAQPSHGSVAVTGSAGSPTLVYTPAAGYYGADSFSFTASNGTNASKAATVTLAVAPATPTAGADRGRGRTTAPARRSPSPAPTATTPRRCR